MASGSAKQAVNDSDQQADRVTGTSLQPLSDRKQVPHVLKPRLLTRLAAEALD